MGATDQLRQSTAADQGGSRPSLKAKITQTIAPKTQQHSIRNSPKLDGKAIYIATDGAETSKTVESTGPTPYAATGKSTSQGQLVAASQMQLKARFQRALLPQRQSRNQLKLTHGSNRQHVKQNSSTSSYGVSRNLQRCPTGGLAASKGGPRALQSSPSIQAFGSKGKKEGEGAAGKRSVAAQMTLDHKIPTATLHLAEPTVGPFKVQGSEGGARAGKLGSPGAYGYATSGYMNPRRPSVGTLAGPLSRTIGFEVQDASRHTIEQPENASSHLRKKVSPRSTQQREQARKKGSPGAAKCRSELSVKSSASRGSNRRQQRPAGQAYMVQDRDQRVLPAQGQDIGQTQPPSKKNYQ